MRRAPGETEAQVTVERAAWVGGGRRNGSGVAWPQLANVVLGPPPSQHPSLQASSHTTPACLGAARARCDCGGAGSPPGMSIACPVHDLLGAQRESAQWWCRGLRAGAVLQAPRRRHRAATGASPLPARVRAPPQGGRLAFTFSTSRRAGQGWSSSSKVINSSITTSGRAPSLKPHTQALIRTATERRRTQPHPHTRTPLFPLQPPKPAACSAGGLVVVIAGWLSQPHHQITRAVCTTRRPPPPAANVAGIAPPPP